MTLTFTINETKTVYQSAGDTASWYYNIEVPAGTYEAECKLIGGEKCSLENAYWVVVKIPGTCVGGWLPGPHGSNGAERCFGKPMYFWVQNYGYSVRDSLASNPESLWAVMAEAE